RPRVGPHRRRHQGAPAPRHPPARGDGERAEQDLGEGGHVSSGTTDFEALLREALSPVDPPEGLTARMEMALISLTELAQDELEAGELKTMRDPRNWGRPGGAVLSGAGGGAAVGVLGGRSRHRPRRQQSANLRELAERTLQDFAEEARRVLPDR